MEFTDVFYNLENEKQFLAEIDELLTIPYEKNELEIGVSKFLSFINKYGEPYLITEFQLQRCMEKFLNSPLYQLDENAVLSIFYDCFFFLKEQQTLKFIIIVFQSEIQKNEYCLRLLASTGFIPVLIKAMKQFKDRSENVAFTSFRYALFLVYYICRSRRLSPTDLVAIDEYFLVNLFKTSEEAWNDEDMDSFGMCVLTLLSINEQFMLVRLASKGSFEIANGIMDLLSSSKVDNGIYSEGLVFTLNREKDPRSRMLILKQLFLLFTTPATYEIFYTNDLNVLIDIFIREINNIPDELSGLRYAYLQVLIPLLENTQVRHPPHYKTKCIVDAVNNVLISHSKSSNMEDARTTDVAIRVLEVPWLQQEMKSLGTAQ
ncbi:Protein dip1 [Schizosaccharomyces pombe]